MILQRTPTSKKETNPDMQGSEYSFLFFFFSLKNLIPRMVKTSLFHLILCHLRHNPKIIRFSVFSLTQTPRIKHGGNFLFSLFPVKRRKGTFIRMRQMERRDSKSVEAPISTLNPLKLFV